MSILNGIGQPNTLPSDKMQYGKEFIIEKEFRIDGATDCATFAIDNLNYLLVAAKGQARIYKITDGNLSFISQIDNIGQSRQISIYNGFAHITVRQSGLYIIDLNNPYQPKIAAHIDTLELATGVCVANNTLAITNRHLGCEIYNVKNPYNPVYIGCFLCGEAQSVWLFGNFAYVGDWINHKVRIIDITDNAFGREISQLNIDGFADGVCVFKTEDLKVICLTASGHHSNRLQNRRKYENFSYLTAEMLIDGYGCGHKITIYDVTDPAQPKFISQLSAPPMFGGVDSWRIFTNGEYCYYTDSMNGLFEIDITDLTTPHFNRRFRLAPNKQQFLSPPSIQIQCGAVTGIALDDNHIYCVGDNTLYSLSTEYRKKLIAPDLITPATTKQKVNIPDEMHFFDGIAHSIARLSDKIYVASGDDGISILDNDGHLLNSPKTNGCCYDVVEYKGFILSAEGDCGLSVYNPLNFIRLAKLNFESGKPVREIVCSNDFIVVEIGCNEVQLIKLEILNETKIKLTKLGNPVNVGTLYYKHIAKTLAADKYIIASPLAFGPSLMEINKNVLTNTGLNLNKYTCPIEEGACAYKGGIILIKDCKYYFYENPLTINSTAKSIDIKNATLSGIPYSCKNNLVILNRVSGLIEVINVSNPKRPEFVKSVQLRISPEFAFEYGNNILVACGRNGIIVI